MLSRTSASSVKCGGNARKNGVRCVLERGGHMKDKITKACITVGEWIGSLFGSIAAGLGCLVWSVLIIGIPVGIITLVVMAVLKGFGVVLLILTRKAKMTREDKIKAFEMRLDGYTFKEIGEVFGVSRQYIEKMLKQKNNKSAPEKVIYKGLRKFLIDEGLVLYELQDLIYPEKEKKYKTQISPTFSRKLKGESEFTISDIERILKVTGMTYEECFKID